jgi:hypothetical protein
MALPEEGLATMYRNALSQHFARRDFTADDLAALDYRVVARLPKIGKQGLHAIRAWLGRQGLDLCNVPREERPAAKVPSGKRTVDRAIRLLERRGYRIIPPGSVELR